MANIEAITKKIFRSIEDKIDDSIDDIKLEINDLYKEELTDILLQLEKQNSEDFCLKQFEKYYKSGSHWFKIEVARILNN